MTKPARWCAALFAVLYLVPLGIRPLAIPDEFRYAEIARELARGGDWIAPRLCGIRYFEKPVLGYWLNAVSVLLFGPSAFALRLTSALATGLTALVVFVLIRRNGRSIEDACLGTTLFLTSLLVFVAGTTCLLDALFALFLTASLAAFFLAHTHPERSRPTAWITGSGACCGLAFLTKGFLAFAVIAIVLLPFMLWERKLRALISASWIFALGCAAVAAPWSAAVQVHDATYWPYFFWVEHVQRFLAAGSAQHVQPPWFYVPMLVAGALPWTFALPSIARLRRDLTQNPLLRFALCWTVLPFLFFSASKGKVATYILPCFPPLAIIASYGLVAAASSGKRKALRFGAAALSSALLGCAAYLVADRYFTATAPRIFGESEGARMWLAVCALSCASALALLAALVRDAMRRIAMIAAASAVFLVGASATLPERIRNERMPHAFLEAQSHEVPGDAIVAAESHLAAAVAFVFDRTDVRILGGTGEFGWGLGQDGTKDHWLSTDDAIRQANDPTRTAPLVLITYRSQLGAALDQFPPRSREATNGPILLMEFGATPRIEALIDENERQRMRSLPFYQERE